MDRGVRTSEMLSNAASIFSGFNDSMQQQLTWKDLACWWVTIYLKCSDMWDTKDWACSWLKIPKYFSRCSCSSNSACVKLWSFSPTVFSWSHHEATFISLSLGWKNWLKISQVKRSADFLVVPETVLQGRIWWIPEMLETIGRSKCVLRDAN